MSASVICVHKTSLEACKQHTRPHASAMSAVASLSTGIPCYLCFSRILPKICHMISSRRSAGLTELILSRWHPRPPPPPTTLSCCHPGPPPLPITPPYFHPAGQKIENGKACAVVIRGIKDQDRTIQRRTILKQLEPAKTPVSQAQGTSGPCCGM